MVSHGTRRPYPSPETKFSGANGDKEMLISPVQLTTSRIGNLTRLIRTLLLPVYVTIKPKKGHVGEKSTVVQFLFTYLVAMQVHQYRGKNMRGTWI